MKIPVYNIMIDLNDDESGMTAISLVEDPAVERDFICFNKEQKPMCFKVEDEMEHKVTGVAIWANKEIYRYDPAFGEYYVVFTPETIDKIVHKYAKQGLNNLVDLQHDGEMIGGVTMVEYYIKDTDKGINPAGFEDVDDGSLFVTYKIEDEKLWNEIISPESEFKGFSIEIYADIVPTNNYVEVEDDDSEMSDEEFANWLEELLKALEEADCEVIMSEDKKKDNFELDFEVERADVSKLIGKSAKVDGVDYWVYGISKDNGKDAAILYNPDKEKYVVKPLTSIREITPLKANAGTFPPLPKEIIDNDDITVQKTIVSNDIPSLMKSHTIAILNYDDELPNPHTGSRQVAIVAYGYTKAGNECFRAYELFGDSRSVATEPLPSWRLFLTKRVRSLKGMFGTEPFTREWLESLSPAFNWNGDRSMEPCVDHITVNDFN